MTDNASRSEFYEPQVLCDDARRLDGVTNGSVDLVITSPPYFAQRDYGTVGQIGAEATPAQYLESLLDVMDTIICKLKPSGSIFWNMGDKYCGYTNGQGKGRSLGGVRGTATVPDGPISAPTVYGFPNKSLMGLPWRFANEVVDRFRLILRAEVLWEKHPWLPERVIDRFQRSHEQWFHFTKRDRYYSNVRDGVFGKRVPGSVWRVSGDPALKPPPELGITHVAMFPVFWPLTFIKGWAPRKGLVLDPFGGSGTTALAAKVSGCRGISVDLSSDYCRLMKWRVNDSIQITRARDVMAAHSDE